jgi:hypothetical protein
MSRMASSASKSKGSNNLTDSGFNDFYCPLPDSRKTIPEGQEVGQNLEMLNINPQALQQNQQQEHYLNKENYNFSNIPPFSRRSEEKYFTDSSGKKYFELKIDGSSVFQSKDVSNSPGPGQRVPREHQRQNLDSDVSQNSGFNGENRLKSAQKRDI